MATRSAIGVMHGDVCKAVYCHWDGYIDHNGRILLEHYSDSAKANQLVALGDISSLRNEIVIPEGVEHSFDAPAKEITVFYGRDRGETGIEFKSFFNDQELFEGVDAEYFYVMNNGVWYVSQGDEWKVLADEVRALDEVEA
jgi:hypothetical protein